MHKPKPKHALRLFATLAFLLPLISDSDTQIIVAVAAVVVTEIRDPSSAKQGILTQSLLCEMVIEMEFDVVIVVEVVPSF